MSEATSLRASRVAYITEPEMHVAQLSRYLQRNPGVAVVHFPRTAPALEEVIGARYALVVIDLHTRPGMSTAYDLASHIQPLLDTLPQAKQLRANLQAARILAATEPCPIVATGLFDSRRRYDGVKLADAVKQAGVREYVNLTRVDILASRLRNYLVPQSL